MTNIEVYNLLLLHLNSIIGIFTLLLFCGDKGKSCRKFEGRKVEKELIPDNLPSANKSMTVAKVPVGCWTSCHDHVRDINFSQMVHELETQFIEDNCIITWSHKRHSDIFKNTFSPCPLAGQIKKVLSRVIPHNCHESLISQSV